MSCQDEPSMTEWDSLSESVYAKVLFKSVQKWYSCCKDVVCVFEIPSGVEPSSTDFIGLYKVGYVELSQYILRKEFKNSTRIDEKTFSVVFSIDHQETGFYQFLYVTQDHNICGASIPFMLKDGNDDLPDSEEDFCIVNPVPPTEESATNTNSLQKNSTVTSEEKSTHVVENLTTYELSRLKRKMDHVESTLHNKLIELHEIQNEKLIVLNELNEQKLKAHKLEGELHSLKYENKELHVEKLAIEKLVDQLNVSMEEAKLKSEDLLTKQKEKSDALIQKLEISVKMASLAHCKTQSEKDAIQKEMLDTKAQQEMGMLEKSDLLKRIDDLLVKNKQLESTIENSNAMKKELCDSIVRLRDTNEKSQKAIKALNERLATAHDLYKSQYLEITRLKAKIEKSKHQKSGSSSSSCVSSSNGANCEKWLGTFPAALLQQSFPKNDKDTGEQNNDKSASLVSNIMKPILEKKTTTSDWLLKSESPSELVHNAELVAYRPPVQVTPSVSSQSSVVSTTDSDDQEKALKENFANMISVVHESLKGCRLDSRDVDRSSLGSQTSSNPQVDAGCNTESSSLNDAASNTDVRDVGFLVAGESVYPTCPPLPIEETVVEFDLPCPSCTMVFSCNKMEDLALHIEEEHKQRMCPICSVLFDADMPTEYFTFHVERHF